MIKRIKVLFVMMVMKKKGMLRRVSCLTRGHKARNTEVVELKSLLKRLRLFVSLKSKIKKL